LLAAAALRVDLARIDPRSRAQRLWSSDRLLEVSYVTCAALVLLAIFAWSLAQAASAIAALAVADRARASSVLASLVADIVLRMGVAAMVLGAIDLVVRRVRARRALRMTRRELRDELRESYGVPEQRARRDRVRREVVALQAMADACVLLLDASGRAVAVGLRPGGPSAARAPYVVAKAQGALATRLRVRATQLELPVRDHAALVSALFRLEPGAPIGAEHHAALAEVLVETSTI
jgi:flagellar biosynthesis protein FlhB